GDPEPAELDPIHPQRPSSVCLRVFRIPAALSSMWAPLPGPVAIGQFDLKPSERGSRSHAPAGQGSGMRLAVLKERRPGETRVAATPETVKKYIGLGLEVGVEAGAG